jgi:hypothetical protein
MQKESAELGVGANGAASIGSGFRRRKQSRNGAVEMPTNTPLPDHDGA